MYCGWAYRKKVAQLGVSKLQFKSVRKAQLEKVRCQNDIVPTSNIAFWVIWAQKAHPYIADIQHQLEWWAFSWKKIRIHRTDTKNTPKMNNLLRKYERDRSKISCNLWIIITADIFSMDICFIQCFSMFQICHLIFERPRIVSMSTLTTYLNLKIVAKLLVTFTYICVAYIGFRNNNENSILPKFSTV